MLEVMRLNLRSCSEKTISDSSFSVVGSNLEYCCWLCSHNSKDEVTTIRVSTKTCCMIQQQLFREHQQHIIDARSHPMLINEINKLKNRNYSFLQSGTQPDRHSNTQIFDIVDSQYHISPFAQSNIIPSIYRFIQIQLVIPYCTHCVILFHLLLMRTLPCYLNVALTL